MHFFYTMQKQFFSIYLSVSHFLVLNKTLKSKDCSINLHGVEHAHQGCEAEANSKHRFHAHLHIKNKTKKKQYRQVKYWKFEVFSCHLLYI